MIQLFCLDTKMILLSPLKIYWSD